MRRRQFISLLGGTAALPFAARAQQADRMRRVGVLMTLAEDDPESAARLAVFRKALNALGWIEGKKPALRLEWQGQDGQDEAEQCEHCPLTLGDSVS